jgi:hypothetical protein
VIGPRVRLNVRVRVVNEWTNTVCPGIAGERVGIPPHKSCL